MPFMQRTAGILLFSFVLAVGAGAQDTLPRFSATAKGTGRILISWHNPFQTVSQISIQRSVDSLKNFTTLLTVPDPTLPENGAMDKQVPHPNFFYRLFIVLENGKYLFTSSRRPQSSTGEAPTTTKDDNDDKETADIKTATARLIFADPSNSSSNKVKSLINGPLSAHGGLPEIQVNTMIYIRKGDSVVAQITGGHIGRFRDSLLNHTKDTLVIVDGDTLLIKPFVPKEEYKISSYVYVAKLGNVHIALPDGAGKHYKIKFFDDSNKLLFELSEIRDPSLTLDKTNFQHAGWFHFELYDGVQLKEKNKFLIPL